MKVTFFFVFILSMVNVAGFAQNRHRFEWKIGEIFLIDSTIVHDPVMIRENNTWYVFSTGWGIDVYSSQDLKIWKREKAVFIKPPQWAVDMIPDFKGHIWAPDISYHDGLYYLYYSVSAFGKNTSAIGVATNKTLNPSDPDCNWVDHGCVIQSIPGVSNWNAIDPNLVVDTDGTPYLAFGSFWDGLQLAQLTPDMLHIATPVDKIQTIASRQREPQQKSNLPSVDGIPVDAGDNAIEAPFIVRHGGYFYLFASIDYCCKGIESTYKIIIGRSKNLKGPYSDEKGIAMRWGGGTILLQGSKKWNGLGHNAVVFEGEKTYLVFHAYDATQNGRSILRIKELQWVDDWPVVK